MKKSFLVWALTFVLLASFSLAQTTDPFTVTIDPAEESILFNESATFLVTITNNQQLTDQFKLYSPDVEWDLQFIPTTDRILMLPSGLSKTVTVKLRPLHVSAGAFGVNLYVKASKGDALKKAILYVGLSATKQPENYLPALYTDVKIPSKIDPRDQFNYQFTLKNRNRKTLPNIDLKIRSNLIQHDDIITLGPLQELNFSIPIKLDDLTSPQSDALVAALTYKEDGKTYHFDSKPAPFEVVAYGDLVDEQQHDRTFFKYIDTIIITNMGNSKREKIYSIETTFLQKLFTRTTPIATSEKQNGKHVLKFPVILNVGESTTLVLIHNYRPLFWSIVILILLIILYQFYKSPIVLTKISTVVATKEGGASELRIVIMVKNRGPKLMTDVLIMDKVPNLAQIVREFESGTLEPISILTHEQKGTLLKWRIDKLDKFEERLISYRIKTRLAVLGNIQFPPAVAKYRTLNGKEKIVTSSVKFTGSESKV